MWEINWSSLLYSLLRDQNMKKRYGEEWFLKEELDFTSLSPPSPHLSVVVNIQCYMAAETETKIEIESISSFRKKFWGWDVQWSELPALSCSWRGPESESVCRVDWIGSPLLIFLSLLLLLPAACPFHPRNRVICSDNESQKEFPMKPSGRKEIRSKGREKEKMMNQKEDRRAAQNNKNDQDEKTMKKKLFSGENSSLIFFLIFAQKSDWVSRV